MASPHVNRSTVRDDSANSNYQHHSSKGPRPRFPLSIVTASTSHNIDELATAESRENRESATYNPFATPIRSPRALRGFESPQSLLLNGWVPASQILGAADNDMYSQEKPSERNNESLRGDEPDCHKPGPVKVARDMYVDGLPPTYERQNWNGSMGTKEAQIPSHRYRQQSTGTTTPQSPQDRQPLYHQHQDSSDCAKCAKSKSTPPSSFPSAAMAGMVSTIPVQRTGLSDMNGMVSSPAAPQHKCGKCGKARKAGRTLSQNSTQGESSRAAHKIPTIQTNGIALRPENEPMSAISEKRPSVPVVPGQGVAPNLLPTHNVGRKKSVPRRAGSISRLIRALSFSRRRKERVMTSPTSNPENIHGREHPGETAKRINNTDSTRAVATSRSGITIPPNRPDSPLSFLEQPREDESFEMEALRPTGSSHTRQGSWTTSDQPESLSIVDKPKHCRSHSAQIQNEHLLAVPPPAEDPTFLGITPDQRPGVTRFKSLRSGVNRTRSQMQRTASQIGRSKSLKRLGSVRKVPQLWYRDDMLFDGSGQSYEYNEYHAF